MRPVCWAVSSVVVVKTLCSALATSGMLGMGELLGLVWSVDARTMLEELSIVIP